MRLMPISELLADARKNHYAIGAFNVINLEMVQAVVRAAETEKTPAIIQVWHGDLGHSGGAYISAIAKVAAKSASVPLALQLDHGQNLEQIKSCIDWGFSSVMIDLSSSDFLENISRTKRVVDEAHSQGISVEAELGKIFSGREPVKKQKSAMTDPDLAAQFVNETGVDALAVSVGTAHGVYVYGPDIAFDLIEKIIELVRVPVVIHGGSGTPDKDIIKMIRLGVAKINVGTALMDGFINGIKESLSDKNRSITLKAIMGHARERVEEMVRGKIRLFNTLKPGG